MTTEKNPLLIYTDRLIIKDLLPEHTHDFFSYRSNPEVTKYQGFDVFTLEECNHFIAHNSTRTLGNNGEWVQYAIVCKTTNTLIGDCALNLKAEDNRIASIGITISHKEQQKGYAKEVMTGLISYLFHNLKVHRIEETVDTENTASIQLLKSLGFRQEAHFIENIYFKGKWGSELVFAMLSKEWKK